jgi:hypothetical protein
VTRQAFEALVKDASPSVQKSGKQAISGSYDDHHHGKASSPEPQCSAVTEPLAAAETQKVHPGLILVRITSYRQRLLDIDNLMPKWHLDCCRYGNLIPDDNPKAIEFSCSQIKVARKTDQRTEVEITYPCPPPSSKTGPSNSAAKA